IPPLFPMFTAALHGTVPALITAETFSAVMFRQVPRTCLACIRAGALNMFAISRCVAAFLKSLAYTVCITLAAPVGSGGRRPCIATIDSCGSACTVGAVVALRSVASAVVPLFLQGAVTLPVAAIVSPHMDIAVDNTSPMYRVAGPVIPTELMHKES